MAGANAHIEGQLINCKPRCVARKYSRYNCRAVVVAENALISIRSERGWYSEKLASGSPRPTRYSCVQGKSLAELTWF